MIDPCRRRSLFSQLLATPSLVEVLGEQAVEVRRDEANQVSQLDWASRGRG